MSRICTKTLGRCSVLKISKRNHGSSELPQLLTDLAEDLEDPHGPCGFQRAGPKWTQGKLNHHPSSEWGLPVERTVEIENDPGVLTGEGGRHREDLSTSETPALVAHTESLVSIRFFLNQYAA